MLNNRKDKIIEIMAGMHAAGIVPKTQTELIGLFGSEKENIGDKSGEEPQYPKCEFIPESEDEDETLDPNLKDDVHVQVPFPREGEDGTTKEGTEEAAGCSPVRNAKNVSDDSDLWEDGQRITEDETPEQVFVQEGTSRCPICKKLFSRKDNMTRHVKTVHQHKLIKCDNCRATFSTIASMKMHVKRVHESRETVCSYDNCGKKYKSVYGLKEHVRKFHEATTNHRFICLECGKAFSHKRLLEGHSVTHTGLKDISCPVCEKKFAYQHNMKSNLKKL